jgi:hypothetical protein
MISTSSALRIGSIISDTLRGAVIRIFLSTEWSADERVIEMLACLKSHPNLQFDQSPLNPLLGDDPRWSDWYDRGSIDAIANADYFVAVVTKGYDSSTWMGHELDVAWKHYLQHGRPLLFVSKPTSQPLPLGFKTYEDASTVLVGAPDTAAATLLEHVRAAEAKWSE